MQRVWAAVWTGLLVALAAVVVAAIAGAVPAGDRARPEPSCSGPNCRKQLTATPTPVWPGRP